MKQILILLFAFMQIVIYAQDASHYTLWVNSPEDMNVARAYQLFNFDMSFYDGRDSWSIIHGIYKEHNQLYYYKGADYDAGKLSKHYKLNEKNRGTINYGKYKFNWIRYKSIAQDTHAVEYRVLVFCRGFELFDVSDDNFRKYIHNNFKKDLILFILWVSL